MIVNLLAPLGESIKTSKRSIQFTLGVNGSAIQFELTNPRRNQANNRLYLSWILDLSLSTSKETIGTITVQFPEFSQNRLLTALSDRDFLEKLLEEVKYLAQKKLNRDFDRKLNLTTYIPSYHKHHTCKVFINLNNPDSLHGLLKKNSHI